MATINTLRGEVPCPQCGQVYFREMQYRYARTWLLSYGLGDLVEWDEHSIGDPGLKKVAAAAWIDPPCPNCGFEGDCEVIIESDRIVGVRPWSGSPELVEGADYIVLEQ